jgi:hypothetical protein
VHFALRRGRRRFFLELGGGELQQSLGGCLAGLGAIGIAHPVDFEQPENKLLDRIGLRRLEPREPRLHSLACGADIGGSEQRGVAKG